MQKIVFTLLLLTSICVYAQKAGFTPYKIEISSKHKIVYKQSHALIIGNSEYSNGWNSLPGVKNDIKEVHKALQLHGFHVEVYQNLNKEQIDKVFSNFIKLYGQKKNNRLLIYFAGHGYTINTPYGDVLAYIVTKNAPLPTNSLADFQAKAMETTQIEIYAKQIKSKHVLFVFDACFSGAMFDTERTVPDALSGKTTGPVRQFITSGSENENVPDKSIFRNQFVHALTTVDADLYRDDYLTGTELGEFLQIKVVNLSKNKQHPQYGKIHHKVLNQGDFVFLLADSIINKDTMAYGTVHLKSKISGSLYLDKRKIKTITANSTHVINKIPVGNHLIELVSGRTWSDSVWVYENKRTQVVVIDDIYHNSNDWMVDSRDGKMYSTIQIKNQVWMAENLNFDNKTGTFCYNDSLFSCNIYGKLYSWEAANNVCLPGWHLPKKSEWKKLLKNLGGYDGVNDFAFSQMVIGGSSDFNALFSGMRNRFGIYDFIGFHAGFWTASEFNKEIATYCNLSKYGQNVSFQNGHKELSLSVRCLKD